MTTTTQSSQLAREIVEAVTGIPLPPRDHVSAELAAELVQVLGEGATEIRNFYGPGNVVAWRLVELRRRVEQSERT